MTIRVTFELVRAMSSSASIQLEGDQLHTNDQKLQNQLKGLILAQNERWRCGLGMQVVRESLRASKAANG